MERWTKAARVRQFATALQEPDRKTVLVGGVDIVNAMFNGFRLAHDELKREFLSCMLQLRFSRFHPTVIHYFSFPKVVGLACSAMCSVLYDIHGTPLINRSRWRPYPSVSVTVFPMNARTHVLVTHHRKLSARLKPFFEQFEGGTDEERQTWLTKLLLWSYENVVFAPQFVDALGSLTIDLVEGWMTHLFERALPMPYVPNFNYFR